MNILHTFQYYEPYVGGACEVLKQISERLVKRGHTVTVATDKLAGRKNRLINGVRIEEFDVESNATPGEKTRYQQFLVEGNFDVMMNYSIAQWATDLVFPVLDQIPYAKVLAPCGFFTFYDPNYSAYFARMPDVMRQYDHLIFHSNDYRDINFARQHGLSHFTVIPNGAAEDEFEEELPSFRRRYSIPDDVPLILTVGNHTGFKGHKLVIESFRRARIGQAVLMIVGGLPFRKGCLPDDQRRALFAKITSLGRKRVLFLNPPRKEVVSAFQAADLFVFGSNIEYSPIVLFEAMASRTAFITTACGNAEEIVEWSQGGIAVPKIQKPGGFVDAKTEVFAGTIEDLIHNPEERNRLAEAGYLAWKKRFTWEKIALEYEQLYTKVIEAKESKHRDSSGPLRFGPEQDQT